MNLLVDFIQKPSKEKIVLELQIPVVKARVQEVVKNVVSISSVAFPSCLSNSRALFLKNRHLELGST